MFALVVVVVGFSVLFFAQNIQEPERGVLGIETQNMQDISIIAFYKRENASGMGVKDNIAANAKYGKCIEQILPTEETSPFNTKVDFIRNKYCEDLT